MTGYRELLIKSLSYGFLEKLNAVFCDKFKCQLADFVLKCYVVYRFKGYPTTIIRWRPAMFQPCFCYLQCRLHKIDNNGDPLAKINETVNRELFRPALEKDRD